jgi:Rps23 Pro-64 3,4-dihydroxylase Tpa1-like proline 4-hydroxylase
MENLQGIRGIAGRLAQLSLPESSAALASRYRQNVPFPHLVIDDLFDPEALAALRTEMFQTKNSDWFHHQTQQIEKLGQKSAIGLGETGFQLIALLHSAAFLYLLSEITGIWNLLPDPYLHGAGFSMIPPGGKFDVHVDLNADATTGLVRKLALIIYLNPDWKPEYGGHLELWDKELTGSVAAIEPVFNRVVLMEISDTGFHGITPVTEPSGRSRCSFMIYYNTAGIAVGKELGVHNSMYAPMCYRPKPSLRSLARKVTPPILYDFVRRKMT